MRQKPTSTLPGHALRRAEEFVHLTARVLEQRRFAHHFLGAGQVGADAVETALVAYRNEDEGYGHALEPGLRGPQSRPVHAVHALHVLDSIERCGGQRVERLGRYLTSVSAPDGALPTFLPGRHPFGGLQGELLSTGPAVGLLHRNDVWHPWLFRATDFCWHAVESLQAPSPYEIEAAVAFLNHVPDRPRAEAAADRLGKLVREHRLAALDPSPLAAGQGGGTLHTAGKHPQSSNVRPVALGRVRGERHFPHQYAKEPQSLARAWFTDDEMARSLDFLAADQQGDGGWPIRPATPGPAMGDEHRWSAGATLEHLERRPVLTIDALCILRAYGRSLG